MTNRKAKVTGQHASPPTEDSECMEAVWSQGRSCKRCGISMCYRQGWSKGRVDSDNTRLVNGGKPLEVK